MNLRDFISNALCEPYAYMAYHVSRRLAEMFPGKAVVEGYTDDFDVTAFAGAGMCSVVAETAVHNQVRTRWRGADEPLEGHAEQGWLNVLWRDHFLDVVYVTIPGTPCPVRRHWIIAETRAVAEDFFRAVCAWNEETHGEILVYQDGGFEKSEELYREIKAATFDNLILPEAFKREIQEDLTRFFASRAFYPSRQRRPLPSGWG